MKDFDEKDIARLALFPEQNPNPVMEVNLKTGEITYINKTAALYFPDIKTKQLEHGIFKNFRKQAEQKKDFQCEVILELKVFEQKIFFIPDSDLARIYSHDITQQKTIERNLSRLASFPEQNPSPIIEIDLQENITYFNPACLINFPEFYSQKLLHPVLIPFKNHFEKFISGDIKEYSTEIFIEGKYYTQRAKLLEEFGVIRIFNLDITQQKINEEIIKEKNISITDSIKYAKRIQNTILPQVRYMDEYLKNYFVLYLPKDIVSGDFYWVNKKDNKLFFAAVDCTGHGVPGALVSMVAHTQLQRAVTLFHLRSPSEILDFINKEIQERFNLPEEGIRDGMDITLCALNREENTLEFSGANNPLWIVRNSNSELIEIKGDKQPIGNFEMNKKFTNHTIELNKNDSIYLFTDGFADQFGGERGQKKLTKKRFKELILSIQGITMREQGIALDKFITNYRKEVEQIDDILVMGVKI